MAKVISYKKAGVDIDKANDFIKKVTPMIEKTYGKDIIGTIGGFSGFFKADFAGMKNPVLVASTDGVGTKALVYKTADKYDTVGIDLVAMCANDVAVCGARPLFFLDYFATGKLRPDIAVEIIKGMVEGCRQAGCALIGGETAEMPSVYRKGDFDLAGFCVGVVDREKILDGSTVRPKDRILGIASSGIHSNGYSLVRKIFSPQEIKGKYRKALLAPTIIYVRHILDLLKRCRVKAAAHITGGGFYDNIPRVLPDGTAAYIEKGSWPMPPIFDTIRKRAHLTDEQMYRTFNMGVGLVAVLDPKDISLAIDRMKKVGAKAWDIGEVIKRPKKEVVFGKAET